MRPLLILLALAQIASADLPTDEAGAITFFKERGDRITLDADNHALKLFSGGKPKLSIAELQLIGKLTHLRELAINASPGGDGDWTFLHDLPELKKLTLWHGHHFSSLTPFAGLPVENLTFGGCMGLRDLNKDDPAKLRDPVLSLRGLPNLKSLFIYPPRSGEFDYDPLLANLKKLRPDLEISFFQNPK